MSLDRNVRQRIRDKIQWLLELVEETRHKPLTAQWQEENLKTYPRRRWARISPAEAGFDPKKLKSARRWLNAAAARTRDGRYRVVIVRGGRVVTEWNHRIRRRKQLRMASAAKSIFSCILGIAIEEGRIPSADARIVDYYPEAMDVPPGEGPKPGRYAFEKDRAITFRQLISNTSGYMKPGEQPGQVFHYQTFGMNILTHAIAKIYGLYDVRDPEGSPGFARLVDEKLRAPIGATWGYYLMNFDHHPQARLHIFGYYDGVQATALDMARLGWLWRNWGRWGDRQLIPEAWLREATQTALDIRANCPAEQWGYGYAFWTNDHGRLWPNLPRDSYAASGAGSQHIWVCPSLDLVVAQSPGLWQEQEENDAGLLRLVVEALRAC
jgi:CubicO group peptidase (beta-lactamase class C family)